MWTKVKFKQSLNLSFTFNSSALDQPFLIGIYFIRPGRNVWKTDRIFLLLLQIEGPVKTAINANRQKRDPEIKEIETERRDARCDQVQTTLKRNEEIVLCAELIIS